MVAIKRKYQNLESESRDLQDLVHMLMDRPRQEAVFILDHMRRTRDTSATLSSVRESDLLTWGRTVTTESDSNPRPSAASDHDSVMRDATEQSLDGTRGSSLGSTESRNDTSRSPKRRLAISDLVNNT